MEEVHRVRYRARAQGVHALQVHHCPHIATAAVPNLFVTRNRVCGRQYFHSLGGRVRCQMFQVYYIHCPAADLTRGGAQVVMQVMGSGCKYR